MGTNTRPPSFRQRTTAAFFKLAVWRATKVGTDADHHHDVFMLRAATKFVVAVVRQGYAVRFFRIRVGQFAVMGVKLGGHLLGAAQYPYWLTAPFGDFLLARLQNRRFRLQPAPLGFRTNRWRKTSHHRRNKSACPKAPTPPVATKRLRRSFVL